MDARAIESRQLANDAAALARLPSFVSPIISGNTS
jgi:hypothetical protein